MWFQKLKIRKRIFEIFQIPKIWTLQSIFLKKFIPKFPWTAYSYFGVIVLNLQKIELQKFVQKFNASYNRIKNLIELTKFYLYLGAYETYFLLIILCIPLDIIPYLIDLKIYKILWY